MKKQQRIVYWQLYFGLVLVLTGALFLADQLLGIGLMADFWPLLILLFGLTFLVGMLASGKKGAGLAIPGAVLVVLGLILFIQNRYNLWVTWAYAWTLLISAAGLGMLIMNRYLKREGLRLAAGWVIGIGLALFVSLGIVFEIILNIFDSDAQSGVFLGAGLVLLGLFVVLSRPLFSRRMHEEPASTPDVVDASFKESESSPVKSADQTRSLGEDTNFTSLHFKSVGEVYLLQGDSCDLRVEGDSQLIDKVVTQWEDDQLKITYNATISDWTGFQWIISENRLRYYVTVKELHHLTIGGAGVIRADGLTGESLRVDQVGIGKLTLKGLQYRELAVKLGGLGDIRIEGQVDSQVVELSGGGDYNALDLLSQEADVTLSGAGSARVWAESTLKAHVSGAGNISYKGTPQVDQNITGLGGVKPL